MVISVRHVDIPDSLMIQLPRSFWMHTQVQLNTYARDVTTQEMLDGRGYRVTARYDEIKEPFIATIFDFIEELIKRDKCGCSTCKTFIQKAAR